jgi:CubicO group peptidase (beta-lactamase class C family)
VGSAAVTSESFSGLVAAPDPGALLAEWDGHVGTAVVSPEGVVASWGDVGAAVRLASVSKPVTALAALVALEEGAMSLTDPAGPPGAELIDLLAHSSGYDFDSTRVLAPPRTRRIYSNSGWEAAFDHLAEASGIPWPRYLQDAVLDPIGMPTTASQGSPAKDLHASVRDLTAFVTELFQPTLVDPSTLARATSPVFPDLDGVLPEVGVQRPNPWGLGFEVRGHKSPHWTGRTNGPRTYGHFGGSGTFLWLDPDAGLGLVGLGVRDFGPWALDLWPRLSDAVLAAFALEAERPG